MCDCKRQINCFRFLTTGSFHLTDVSWFGGRSLVFGFLNVSRVSEADQWLISEKENKPNLPEPEWTLSSSLFCLSWSFSVRSLLTRFYFISILNPLSFRLRCCNASDLCSVQRLSTIRSAVLTRGNCLRFYIIGGKCECLTSLCAPCRATCATTACVPPSAFRAPGARCPERWSGGTSRCFWSAPRTHNPPPRPHTRVVTTQESVMTSQSDLLTQCESVKCIYCRLEQTWWAFIKKRFGLIWDSELEFHCLNF